MQRLPYGESFVVPLPWVVGLVFGLVELAGGGVATAVAGGVSAVGVGFGFLTGSLRTELVLVAFIATSVKESCLITAPITRAMIDTTIIPTIGNGGELRTSLC